MVDAADTLPACKYTVTVPVLVTTGLVRLAVDGTDPSGPSVVAEVLPGFHTAVQMVPGELFWTMPVSKVATRSFRRV